MAERWRIGQILPSLLLALVLPVSVLAQGTQATQGTQGISNASLDEHVTRLTSELRCLVCQNQTVADSQAELALQLKKEIRQQLARGSTDEEVRAFMVQRYGDFVLYKPRLNSLTWLLWGGPLLLLGLAALLVGLYWRERRAAWDDGAPDSVLPTEEVHA